MRMEPLLKRLLLHFLLKLLYIMAEGKPNHEGSPMKDRHEIDQTDLFDGSVNEPDLDSPTFLFAIENQVVREMEKRRLEGRVPGSVYEITHRYLKTFGREKETGNVVKKVHERLEAMAADRQMGPDPRNEIMAAQEERRHVPEPKRPLSPFETGEFDRDARSVIGQRHDNPNEDVREAA